MVINGLKEVISFSRFSKFKRVVKFTKLNDLKR